MPMAHWLLATTLETSNNEPEQPFRVLRFINWQFLTSKLLDHGVVLIGQTVAMFKFVDNMDVQSYKQETQAQVQAAIDKLQRYCLSSFLDVFSNEAIYSQIQQTKGYPKIKATAYEPVKANDDSIRLSRSYSGWVITSDQRIAMPLRKSYLNISSKRVLGFKCWPILQ